MTDQELLQLKKCTKCGKEKPPTVDYFYKDKRLKSGLTSWCKDCISLDIKKNKLENPDKIKEINRKATKKWRKANKDTQYNATEHWRKQHLDLDFLYTYGITLEVFNNMISEQSNKCKICGVYFENRKQQKIDHDHSCCDTRGKKLCGNCIRGILCNNCNAALGFLKDNPILCENAAKYLRGEL